MTRTGKALGFGHEPEVGQGRDGCRRAAEGAECDADAHEACFSDHSMDIYSSSAALDFTDFEQLTFQNSALILVCLPLPRALLQMVIV